MGNFNIGIIGLSVMGRSLALNMADHGFRVAAFNRSASVTEQMMKEYPHENVTAFYDLGEMLSSLERPRKVMMMIQAGTPVDAVIEQLIPLLEAGDIVMDGGNSFFEDTIRRTKYLEEKGIRYLGIGISGGEEGARKGPSIMPGGSPDAYEFVRPVLESIAAKAAGEACCTFIGPEGAGHYVKMVHNGIEYADMQLIGESYLLLKHVGGFSNSQLADLFAQWNEGELSSFLIGITADIFTRKDDLSDKDLIDVIVDSAKQKGTGRWTSIQALKQGIDTSMITAACNARIMSNDLARRERANQGIPSPKGNMPSDKAAFGEMVRKALYAGKIIAYAQGFALMKDASEQYGWNLNLGKIASIFRAGCIIQAAFLNDITNAFGDQIPPENLIFNEFFLSKVQENQASLREAVSTGVLNGLPIPAFSNAVSYLDAFRAANAGANLIQAQRDCFGAHTYERLDRAGTFHYDWGQSK